MRSLICLAMVGLVAVAATGFAQEEKKKPSQKEITKAAYVIKGVHCPACITTLEVAMKKAKGVQVIKVNPNGQGATIEFDESVISAQEVARTLSVTPHMMGKDMQYGGVLVLSVPGVKDKATGQKATDALKKVSGVTTVTVYPPQEAVGIEFAAKGKATSKQLIEALDEVGLKGAQYKMGSGTSKTDGKK